MYGAAPNAAVTRNWSGACGERITLVKNTNGFAIDSALSINSVRESRPVPGNLPRGLPLTPGLN
jgi:hypothetical protein